MMEIRDASRHAGVETSLRAEPLSGGAAQLTAEHRMEVFINGTLAMRVTCTPAHLDELAAGRLLTEGLIDGAADIRLLSICELGLTCRVFLREGKGLTPAADQAVNVGTCCTESRSFLGGAAALPRVTPIPWRSAWLRALNERLNAGEPLYSLTHASHACYLARGPELLCVREDIGRHNALDKAVGFALKQGISLRECLLFTTGRLPADMVSKAVRAGVPLMASKTYPTDQGLALARQAGMTLVTLRGSGMTVWTGRKPDDE